MNQKHYLDLDSDVSSIWNFCAHCPGIISRGNQLWHREMLAVFSGYPITIFFWKLKILNLSSHTVGMKLQCINAAINTKIQYDGPANFICGEFSCPANFSFCQFSFFFVIFNYQAFHKTLRKGLIQILLGVTIGEILTIVIVLQQATWILRQYCNIKGAIAIVLP